MDNRKGVIKIKHTKIFSLLVVLILVSAIVSASMLIPINNRAKENAKAPEKSPVIGENWELERVDFVHYAKPANPGKPPKTETCYKLLGVKWKTLPVNYVINPTNQQNLSQEFITSAISISAETWDNATSSELFDDVYEIDYNAQYGLQNFENAIVFGDYPQERVIGVTSIWYTRKGKQIVEFDILLDTDFVWGDARLNPNVMDLQNIATHELGHGVGLDDIYTDTCSEVTMYGYSNYGETKKRTLEQPDINGLQKMYGI